MSEISRRGFLKASVVGVGVAGAVEGCGESSPSGMSADAGTLPPVQPPATDAPPREAGTGGMTMRSLGGTGLMVSIIGFGAGSQYLLASEGEAERMIHRAIELGINYFDTAFNYGGNQESQKRYGKYLVPMYRSGIVLVSKSEQRTAEGAKRELDQTLVNLGTDHLDILHFHAIGSIAEVDSIVAKGGAYEVYQKAKADGVIRFMGVSGHSSGAILVNALQRIKPDVVMCPQNAARELGFTEMVIPYGQQNNIGLLGMKITAQNALIRNGVKPEDLVRYSLSLPVSAMIVGMNSMAVLDSCGAIARGFTPLGDAEMSRISGQLASLDLPRCLPYRRPGYADRCYATAWA